MGTRLVTENDVEATHRKRRQNDPLRPIGTVIAKVQQ